MSRTRRLLHRVRRMLESLRWRLTLTYVALLALLLAGLGVYQYLTLQRSLVDGRVAALRADVDEGERLLRLGIPRTFATETASQQRDDLQRVRNVSCQSSPAPPPASTSATPAAAAAEGSAALLADPSPTPSPVAPPSSPQTPRAPAVRAALAQLLIEAFTCDVHVAGGATIAVAVYNRTLQGFMASASRGSATDISRPDSSVLQRAQRGAASDPTVIDGSGGPQLVLVLPVDLRHDLALRSPTTAGRIEVVQVSTTTSSIDTLLSDDRRRLALGGGGVLLAALLAGLILTGRALRPLHRLTATARELAGGDLRARSRIGRRGDEVGVLARSFDDMADRIEQSFTIQAESEARMRRFIADASHELRTPVTALTGYIDVLRRGAATDPGALDAALGAMARESERMRLLVLDLLTLARLDAHRPLTPETVDLNTVIGAMLDDGVPGMPAELERHLAAAPVVASADANALVTMARNLLVNACKYAPGARQVWSTALASGRAVFSVHDDGPGIPAADLPHVFERFYRGEKTRAREEGGSGLGLSIVQGLARAMGGDVGIESVEGSGTTVTVWLPAARSA